MMHFSSSVSRSSNSRSTNTLSPNANSFDNDTNRKNTLKKLIASTHKRLNAKLDKNDALTKTQKDKITKKAINKIKRKNLTTAKIFNQPLTLHYGNNRLKIATINPDCITNDRLRDLTNFLEKNKIDFAGIQETHDTRDTTIKCNNYTYISAPAKQTQASNGANSCPEAGVAFLTHNKWISHIQQTTKYNERHIEIRLRNLVITNSYAPDSSYSNIARERYWETLEKNIYKVSDNNITHIWTTDNNGQRGANNKNPYVGPHARVRNHEKGNGQKLAALIKKTKMRATNTFFYKHRVSEDKLATWTSPCGRYTKQLDYILINQHRANWVKNAYALGPANRGNVFGHKIVVVNLETSCKKNFKRI